MIWRVRPSRLTIGGSQRLDLSGTNRRRRRRRKKKRGVGRRRGKEEKEEGEQGGGERERERKEVELCNHFQNSRNRRRSRDGVLWGGKKKGALQQAKLR